MQDPIDAALADPWGTVRAVAGDPLHPGGREATEDLLDRAGVDTGTVLVDVGCGAGVALEAARERNATAVGVDRTPIDGPAVRGDVTALPVGGDSADVVLAECVLCLTDTEAALADARRVLGDGGRLALSDVVAAGDVAIPEGVAEALCLGGARSHDALIAAVEDAGFAVGEVRDHREDLLAMRDRLAEGLDYEGLLAALGTRGRRALDAIETLEAAVEDGRVGYVSLVASRD